MKDYYLTMMCWLQTMQSSSSSLNKELGINEAEFDDEDEDPLLRRIRRDCEKRVKDCEELMKQSQERHCQPSKDNTRSLYGVKLFEDLLDNRYLILKTDHMNLTYINVTFTGKVLRWKMYLQDKDFDLFHVAGKEEHQFVPDALSRLSVNHIPPPPTLADKMFTIE